MVKEEIYSGYCRRIDASRMVTLELDEDEMFIDCHYGGCPYEHECTIAQDIRKSLEKQG